MKKYFKILALSLILALTGCGASSKVRYNPELDAVIEKDPVESSYSGQIGAMAPIVVAYNPRYIALSGGDDINIFSIENSKIDAVVDIEALGLSFSHGAEPSDIILNDDYMLIFNPQDGAGVIYDFSNKTLDNETNIKGFKTKPHFTLYDEIKDELIALSGAPNDGYEYRAVENGKNRALVAIDLNNMENSKIYIYDLKNNPITEIDF